MRADLKRAPGKLYSSGASYPGRSQAKFYRVGPIGHFKRPGIAANLLLEAFESIRRHHVALCVACLSEEFKLKASKALLLLDERSSGLWSDRKGNYVARLGSLFAGPLKARLNSGNRLGIGDQLRIAPKRLARRSCVGPPRPRGKQVMLSHSRRNLTWAWRLYNSGCRGRQIGDSTIASQAIVPRCCCSRTSDYTIVQRYIGERIPYWLCRPAALELRRSQDGRNAVCLRRAERQDLVPYRDGR